MQRGIARARNVTAVLKLQQQLTELDRGNELRQKLRQVEERRNRLIDEIEAMVRSGNDQYRSVRQDFAANVRAILSVPAVLSTSVNRHGNLEFNTSVIEGETIRRETSESEGTSYKKVLCASFDLALLMSWAKNDFYRFVYHDGIFEGLDNRKKVALLEQVRDNCSKYDLQYILTVIDSDLPRDDSDNKLLFSQDEVILELHDGGKDGRLFSMKRF